MIAIIAKIATVLEALMEIIKVSVQVVTECKKVYISIKTSLAENETEVESTEVNLIKLEQNNVPPKTKSFNYPEVDTTIFQGKMYDWSPATSPD